MEQVTPNVFTTTKLRGCNPSFVVTSDGVVVIDTPQLPTKAVAMREAAEGHGPIRYLINTENHVDHIFGNYWFKGAGEVVNHKALWDIFMDPKAALDPFDYALEAIPTDDPEGAALLPDRDAYYADLPRGTVVFTGDLSSCGSATTRSIAYWTPGHTPGQLAVHVPEERVVFTGDTIFSGVPDVADDLERRPVARGAREDPGARRRLRRAGPRPGRDVDVRRRPSARC